MSGILMASGAALMFVSVTTLCAYFGDDGTGFWCRWRDAAGLILAFGVGFAAVLLGLVVFMQGLAGVE